MALAKLKVGTRGSKLALIQTRLVTAALERLQPKLEIETVVIKTEGDKNFAPIPLDTVGKAWFTAEIDRALLERNIDLAVHSLKDLPLALDPGLTMVTSLERADPRDALVSRAGHKLAELAKGAVVGTDSTRRRALILHQRPDLKVTSLRGNVQTRLRKLREGQYDAVVLAVAGLDRLGDLSEITEFLDPTVFIPAIGQGALAVEVRRDHTELLSLLQRTEDPATVTTTRAERAFSDAVGGGCKLPVGCFARLERGRLHLYAMIAELDGTAIMFEQATGAPEEAESLAGDLARKMLAACTFDFQPQPEHS